LIIPKDKWIIFGDILRKHDEHIRNLERKLIKRDDQICKLETKCSELQQTLLEVKRTQALVLGQDLKTKGAISLSSNSIPFRTDDRDSSEMEA
jgi:hypothetical protein